MKKTTFSGLSRIRRKHQMKIFQLLQEGESTCNQIAKTLKLSQVSTYIILEDLLQKKLSKPTMQVPLR